MNIKHKLMLWMAALLGTLLVSAMVIFLAVAGQVKYSVCHVTNVPSEGDGRIINIAEPGLDAHAAHGDKIIDPQDPSVTDNGDGTCHVSTEPVAPWINPFGFEVDGWVTKDPYPQRVEELGSNWARMGWEVSWRKLQPDEGGPINWDLLVRFEDELRVLADLGVRPIVVVDDFPRWATIAPNSCSPLKAVMFDDYAEFIVQLVHRYKTPEFNVNNWELGNEVDIDAIFVPVDSHYGCWGDVDDLEYYGGDYYGEMVKVVGPAIKAEDPDARVWLGGLMVLKWNTTDPFFGKPENFLRGVLASGAAPYFDVVPYHGHMAYYGKMKDIDSEHLGSWAPWGGGALGKPRFLRSIMQDYGVDKILSLNEVGVGCKEEYEYCDPPTAEFYQFQASFGMRYAVRVVSENVESFIWYTLNSPSWRNTGLVYDDRSPRPVFYAYQNLISLTEGLSYSHMVDYGEGIEAHEFSNNDTWLQVIWTDIDEEKIIKIPKDHFQAAIDRDGNPITVGNNFKIAVGFAPIYLTFSR